MNKDVFVCPDGVVVTCSMLASYGFTSQHKKQEQYKSLASFKMSKARYSIVLAVPSVWLT